MKIGTHNGRFHTDEVFAVAALLLLYPEAEIVRSRDEKALRACDIRVDVGRKHLPETGDFDHHQGGIEPRPNGIQYSSFGLVWRAFGEQITHSAEICRRVDESIVQGIDAQDNGQEITLPKKEFGWTRPYVVSEVINLFNPEWDSETDPNDAFRQAVELARSILQRFIARCQSAVRAEDTVRKAVQDAKDPRIVTLHKSCPWQGVILPEAPNVRFVVLRDDSPDEKWVVQCVPTSFGGREYRKKLPTSWQNLDRESFAALTGVPDAQFVHNNLFICGARSLSGALRLASIALE